MFKWGQVPLEKVNCYKYLGLYLFSDMNFSKTARFFFIRISNKSTGVSDIQVQINEIYALPYTKLFNSLVCPITEYGAGIWGLGEFENIILVNSLPNLLRSPPTRSKNLPGCRYGWLSDYNRRQVEMLRTWNRLVKLPKDRLTYKIFSGHTKGTLHGAGISKSF